MIDFDSNGKGAVRFDIVSSKCNQNYRRKIEMPLEHFIALVRVSRTLEELRREVFSYKELEIAKGVGNGS